MEPGPEFEPWVAARQRSLLRTAWLLTGDGALAEDLVQATLLRCWPHWRRVQRMDGPDAYVRQAMTNLFLSWRRRRWHGEVPTDVLPDRPVEDRTGSADRTALLAALSRLSHRQRATVVLRFADDLSEAQTAEALGCSVGTVKSQTARALSTLRADVELLREVHS